MSAATLPDESVAADINDAPKEASECVSTDGAVTPQDGEDTLGQCNPHPCTSERGGHPGWGWGVIGRMWWI